MQVASELSLKDEGKTVCLTKRGSGNCWQIGIKIEPILGVAKTKVGRGVGICLSKG